MSAPTRIDKWLWAVRLFKTRSLAAEACRGGHVLVGDQAVKPARDLRVGDVVHAKAGDVQRTVKVLGFPSGRVGAKLVPDFMEDLTPEAEFQKARESEPTPQFTWSKGFGRPTKRSRRLWEQFGSEGGPSDAE